MTKDRFDRLDEEDIFDKPPAPPPEVTRTRFSREDILAASRRVHERPAGVPAGSEPHVLAASIRDAEDERILSEVQRVAAELRAAGVTVDSDLRAQLEQAMLDPDFTVVTNAGVDDDGPHEEASYTPGGWLFALARTRGGERFVCFTPVPFFEMRNTVWEHHVAEMPVAAYIPPYLTEEMEATFTFLDNTDAITDEMVRDDLRARGFQEDPRFQALVQGPTEGERRNTFERSFQDDLPEDWIFGLATAEDTDGRRHRIVAFVPSRLWLARPSVMAGVPVPVTVLRYLNDHFPSWIGGELERYNGAFWLDPEDAPVNQVVISELEANGFIYSEELSALVNVPPPRPGPPRAG